MDTMQLAQKLVLWIKDKVLATGSRGVVIGMSGGIDSSVLSVLCHRAFPQNTMGIIMPCYSDPVDEAHARAVAGKFTIPTEKVTLDPAFDALVRALPARTTEASVKRLAEANIKARLRMLTLYYFANQLRYIVVGSSNRSEIAAGYFTKYGDGAADILPLGSLVKTQIRELAKFLGVPQPIIDKPPSAGLWPGQISEAELGFTYVDLDRYLITGEASEPVKAKIESRIAANTHKCLPAPIFSFRE